MSEIGYLFLLLFVALGGFGIYAGVAKLFIVAVIGAVSVLFGATTGIRLFSFVAFGTLIYGVYLTVEIALKMFF